MACKDLGAKPHLCGQEIPQFAYKWLDDIKFLDTVTTEDRSNCMQVFKDELSGCEISVEAVNAHKDKILRSLIWSKMSLNSAFRTTCGVVQQLGREPVDGDKIQVYALRGRFLKCMHVISPNFYEDPIVIVSECMAIVEKADG